LATGERRGLYPGLFCLTAATLLLELTLTRILDVVLSDNFAYLVVSSAIFGFAFAGVLLMISTARNFTTERLLGLATGGFAISVVLLIPVFKTTPADLNDLTSHPMRQLAAFAALYLCLLLPFLASGLGVATILTRHAADIHRLYLWDLSGAAVGCLGIFVLPSAIGGEETLLVVATAAALAGFFLLGPSRRSRTAFLIAAIALAGLAVGLRNRIEFPSLQTKRGARLGSAGQRAEFSRWDPVSKIDVIRGEAPFVKRIAYDGGSQSSLFFAFDGDYASLRQNYFRVDHGRSRYNSGKYVALAHWLKRDAAPVTLVIGSAGGQETLAALAWGAARVDAVEMVCAVIEAAKGPYADFTGQLFTDPRVRVRCDEGRSFLRHTDQRYDIIQMHSNHTTSSLANGAGGSMPIYLQTVEAYKEYFSHLSRDGILQVNYFVYPRMITTAARAWHELFPGEDFRQYLVITSGYGPMPTFLVKRSPWSAAEITAIREFLSDAFPDERTYRLIYAPGAPEARNVPPEFFESPLPANLEEAVPYKVFPPTDDRPFFRDLRKEIRPLEPDPQGYVPRETADFLNASLKRSIPMESAHLYVLGGLSVVVAGAVTLVPLLWLRRRGLQRPEAPLALLYFLCLGAGFILIELALMSKFLLLVGHPIYAMATVLFTLLISAGWGSYLSSWLSKRLGRGAILATVALGLVLMLVAVVFPHLRDWTLRMNQITRILFVGAFVVPIGIPMGMPFPLGIKILNTRAPDLIPWAWGANGFMTVVGSLLAVVLPMRFGFTATLLVAAAIYIVAMMSYLRLTRTRGPVAA
jgi:spermidine synthase